MHDSSNIKIAVLTGISCSDGGLYYAVTSLCRELRARSIDVSVFGPGGKYTDEDRRAWGEVPVVPYKTFSPMGFSCSLRGGLAKSKVGLVHQHGIWLDNQWASLQWQQRTKRPVVISPHGMLDPWAIKNAAWKKKLAGALFANKSLKDATCIHALCRSEVESIRAYGLRNPVALIPNGVELPRLGSFEGRRSQTKMLLFLGRIHPKKGLAELLLAWPRFSKDWKLVVAGWDDGGHEQGLRAQAGKMGIGDRVEFLGPQYGEKKEQLLRVADAFVLPSFSEGLPMSVLEAWSFRLPVVMTGFCNLPEGFDAGAAVQIEPNEDSILQGLEQLAALTDEELQAMGSNGRALVEERFTWSKIAENMAQVYQWCLTGSNPPACMEFSDG
ncbi:glycosyltransferase [Pontiella sulfatireligans]|uniref:D-inositol 3-phosphate glycosyltransferase n=1 Tax=Pontiella sulfatireligans TaxID=2750658 RepID=A0A6C2URV7_9BACT|nr:glycosyltransferase [Pontiella sulfatireligans]VGO21666.1 D-inositol 3-phosphate glycosyltransferase [Pontiella sulfatireligans]